MKRTPDEDAFELVINLAAMQVQCDTLPDLSDGIGISIRGKDGLLSVLRNCLKLLQTVSTPNKDILFVEYTMKDWISYFTKGYKPENKILSMKPARMKKKDAEKLARDIDEWLDKIVDHFTHGHTALIKSESFSKLFSASLVNGLDKGIKDDLKDGVELVSANFPTAAEMILLRSAEGIIKNYYKEKSGNDPSEFTLDEVIKKLEENHQLKKMLVNHLNYIRAKRNEAAHTGKRFTQEDSEETLMHIRALLKEMKTK